MESILGEEKVSKYQFCQSVIEEIINLIPQIEIEKRIKSETESLASEPIRLLSPLLEKANLIFNIKKGKDSLKQVKVLTQADPVSCGYYCFHNTYFLLKACRSQNLELLNLYIQALISPTCYWRRNLTLKKFLQQKCLEHDTNSFPWDIKTLETGVMERSYLRYILHSYGESKELMVAEASKEEEEDLKSSYNHFHANKEHSYIVTLADFCKGSFTNNAIDNNLVFFLNDVFNHFRNASNHTTAFIVGSVNHWAVILANKVDKQSEVLFVDSRMRDILNASEDELKKIVSETYDEQEKLKNKKTTYREWREEMFFQSMRDFIWIAEMIHNLIHNELNFVSVYATTVIDHLLESFRENVGNLDDSLEASKITQWILDYYPLKVFENSYYQKLFQLGNLSSLIKHHVLQAYIHWIDFLNQKFSDCPELKGFLEILFKIKNRLFEKQGNL